MSLSQIICLVFAILHLVMLVVSAAGRDELKILFIQASLVIAALVGAFL